MATLNATIVMLTNPKNNKEILERLTQYEQIRDGLYEGFYCYETLDEIAATNAMYIFESIQ